jgi:molybdenum cofactor synthesis domain-containing protein
MPTESPAAGVVTAAIVVIGNEVLSGRTQDANLAYIAEGLASVGIRTYEARVVRDDEADIVRAVNDLRRRFTYVFTTGGIGPTHDDITAECIARAFGVPLMRHPEAVRRLESHYPPGHLNEARLRMANVPEGGVLIDNPVSRAPGFRIGNVFVMAGVPSVMRAMFDGIKGQLQGGAMQLSRTVSCTLGEGVIAKDLGALQQRYADLEIGSYPYFRAGGFGVSLVLRGTDPERLASAVVELSDIIRKLGGDPKEDRPS